ncbi:MAG: hypothetical protein ABIY37_01495 [Devosia sp.]
MMHKYTRYWLTTVSASEGVAAHEAGQIIDYGQTGPEGMMWFEGHGPSEGYGVIEGELSDEKFRVDVATGIPYAWEPPEKPPTAEQIRWAAMRADAAAQALRQKLLSATPQEIEAYVDQGVTNLADAKTMFKRLLKLIAANVRG